MPAWDSFPVSVVYKAGDECPPAMCETLHRGLLRKDRVPSEEAEANKGRWKQGLEVAKHKALTPTGKEAWQGGRFDREAWEDKKIPPCRLFTNDDPEEAEQQVWSPGSGRGKAQDKSGTTRGLRGRKASQATSMLNREQGEYAKPDEDIRHAADPNHRVLYSHAHEARKVFANLCCKEKQDLDALSIRTAKQSEAAQHDQSPSTRAPSPSSPVRGWDLTPSPKNEKIVDISPRKLMDDDQAPSTSTKDGDKQNGHVVEDNITGES